MEVAVFPAKMLWNNLTIGEYLRGLLYLATVLAGDHGSTVERFGKEEQ